jgi:hypothetical protein
MRSLMVICVVCISIVGSSPIVAEASSNGNGNGGGGHENPPAISATPELDSLALFGTGIAGMVGYGLMRVRATRRRNDK